MKIPIKKYEKNYCFVTEWSVVCFPFVSLIDQF